MRVAKISVVASVSVEGTIDVSSPQSETSRFFFLIFANPTRKQPKGIALKENSDLYV